MLIILDNLHHKMSSSFNNANRSSLILLERLINNIEAKKNIDLLGLVGACIKQ